MTDVIVYQMQLPDDVAWDNPIQHEVWSEDEVKAVRLTHVDPKTITDKTSLTLAKITRVMFDKVTGYKHEGRLSPAVWLRRLIFLETIAGVPGMVRPFRALVARVGLNYQLTMMCAYARLPGLMCPSGCGDVASLEVPAPHATRPRLDPHAVGRGRE